ncbi:hypothetical protein WM26_16135 [Burkholderia cepacia]|uniref:hypothetical protein n=1 Tax=Burkholderia cepacia TaxID=292 RepID=UPI00075FDF8D|nr:hypothetical protein [Burkholderia cepacia]KWO11898.1 hypothetical protein WM26_16135 [Burkholderia cepacia]
MRPAFDPFTPVVNLGATARPFTWGEQKWVLWPAFAFRVQIGERRGRPFNLFQRAVLDLCEAGVRDARGIHERIALSPDLIAFLLAQLCAMDLLDEHHRLTVHARQLLTEGEEPQPAQSSGYVFVDAHSHRLWPRLHLGSLLPVEAQIDRKGPQYFMRGTRGTPRETPTRVLWPALHESPARPSALELRKAVRQHVRRAAAFALEAPSAQHARTNLDDPNLDDLNLENLRLVGTEPEPVFVPACVFFAKDARQQTWFVTDPCGLGVSDVLRPGLEELARDKKSMHGVDKLLAQLGAKASHVDGGDLALLLGEVHRKAAARLAHRLGEGAALLPDDVIDKLVDADMLADEPDARQIDAFLGNAHAALEALFAWLALLHVNPGALGVLSNQDVPHNAELLNRIVVKLGFTTSDEVARLLRVRGASVKGALRHGNKSLRECLAAALLAAATDPNHPLAALAAREPGALQFIARLKPLRNQASHATRAVATPTEARKVQTRLFALLRAFLGEGPPEPIHDAQDPAWGADLLLRIRVQAEWTVNNYAGIGALPELRTRLIEMHSASRIVELIASEDGVEPKALSACLRNLLVSMAIAVEALFAELERVAPSLAALADEISGDRERNREKLISAAAAVGFALDASGNLPSTLTQVRPERVRRAARGDGETLSSRVMIQVLTAARQEDHPLREIAPRAPRLLLNLGKLVEARGHGSEIATTAEAAQQLETTLKSDIRAVLDVIA